MNALLKSLLLFSLNWADGQLTLVWVHMNIATEGNGLMARLMKHGDYSFLSVKVLIGAVASAILYRCYHLPLARRGMTLVLAIYGALMLIHAATGCVALGWYAPIRFVEYLVQIPTAVLGFLS